MERGRKRWCVDHDEDGPACVSRCLSLVRLEKELLAPFVKCKTSSLQTY